MSTPGLDWPVGVGVPAGVDVGKPSVSRMYDFYLGGSHNFATDREVAGRVLTVAPWVRDAAHINRAFLRRVVRYLVRDAGVRQLLDLGSGIPTVGNVHEVAQSVAADCRVVYVDNDPVAVAHSRQLLAHNVRARVIEEDIRSVDAILDHWDTRSLLDFNQPVAVLMLSVLLFLPDTERPHDLVGRYVARLSAGSYLAISHGTDDDATGALQAQIEDVTGLYRAAGTPVAARSRDEIEAFFAGLTLVPPGVVHLPQWRPEDDRLVDASSVALGCGGLAHKPNSANAAS